MKNKLLLTSALVSGLVAFGAAQADETKITGDYKLSYKMMGGKDNATAGVQGFGRETQINVSKSGELSNGIAYSTGFSFEADGNQSYAASDEGVYIALSMGDTTLTIGQDKAPNMDTDAVPRVGEVTSTGAAEGASKYSRDANTLYGSFGVALTQKVAGGALTLNYVPQVGDTGAQANDAAGNIEGKAGYEVLYKGSLGVEGLTVYAGMNDKDNDTGAGGGVERASSKNSAYGAAYNFGQFAVGFGITKEEGALNSAEQKTSEVGATFAVADNISVGIGHAKTEDKGSGNDPDEEKVNYIQAGYNLGGITFQASYYDIENGGWTAGNDVETLLLRAGAKF